MRRASLIVGSLALWGLMSGCNRTATDDATAPPAAPAPAPVGVRAIPAPDLSQLTDPGVVEAIERAQRDLQEHDRSAESWAQLGHVLLANQFRPEAITCYHQATELAAGDFRWWYYLGRAQLKTDAPAAQAALEQAASLEDHYAPLHAALAGILEQQNQPAQLERHRRRVVELAPQSDMALLLQAALAQSKGDSAAARAHLEALLEQNPNCREARTALLEICRAVGDSQGAAAQEEALKSADGFARLSDPLWDEVSWSAASAAALLHQAELLQGAGRFTEAVDRYQRFLDHHEPSPEMLLNYGTALLNDGNLRDSRQVFARALELTQNLAYQAEHQIPPGLNIKALEGMALVSGRLEQWDAAEELLREALAIDPRSERSRLLLANLLCGRGIRAAKGGDFEGAETQFRAAHEIAPGIRDTNYNLAWVLHKLGRSAEARPLLEQLLAKTPDQGVQDLLKDIDKTLAQPPGARGNALPESGAGVPGGAAAAETAPRGVAPSGQAPP